MAKPLVTDQLWERIQPLLPPERPKPKGGRPPKPDRAVLGGIIFVLRTGIPWEYLPAELGAGSGMTCWRRLRDGQEAGIWKKLHKVMLDELGDAEKLDWERASIDSQVVPAKRGANTPARIRRIAERRARSAMLWSTRKASRSR